MKKADEERIDRCSAEIEMVLTKHNCVMLPQIILRGGTIIPQVVIVPRGDNQPAMTLTSKVEETDDGEE